MTEWLRGRWAPLLNVESFKDRVDFFFIFHGFLLEGTRMGDGLECLELRIDDLEDIQFDGDGCDPTKNRFNVQREGKQVQ